MGVGTYNSSFSQKESTVGLLTQCRIFVILDCVVKQSLGAAEWNTAEKQRWYQLAYMTNGGVYLPPYISAWACSSAQASFTTLMLCVCFQMIQCA